MTISTLVIALNLIPLQMKKTEVSTFNRPRYWSKKEDFIVTALFSIVSTEKLSVLMGISTASIVSRKKYLENINKNGQFKR